MKDDLTWGIEFDVQQVGLLCGALLAIGALLVFTLQVLLSLDLGCLLPADLLQSLHSELAHVCTLRRVRLSLALLRLGILSLLPLLLGTKALREALGVVDGVVSGGGGSLDARGGFGSAAFCGRG